MSVVYDIMNHETKIEFKELLVNLLSKLSEREQEVLRKRYQLTNDLDKKATLKQIGDTYQITRERVRQIERDALRKLVNLKSEKEFSGQLSDLEKQVASFIKSKGGLVREDALLQDYIKQNHEVDFFHTNAYLFVFDNLLDELVKIENHEHLHDSWTISAVDLEKLANWLNALTEDLVAKNKVQEHKNILKLAEEKLADELKSDLEKLIIEHPQASLTDFIEAYLHASRNLEKNILNQWGHVEWDSIRPKKLGDKIKLIFESNKEPLHFRDLAERINSANFDHKNICAATVHNELIANNNYVLIGRGIYAMKDWGYSTGTVADIIANILQERGQALTKQEIYEQVLKQRKVNKSTIYLTLINKDKFTREGDKFAMIVK